MYMSVVFLHFTVFTLGGKRKQKCDSFTAFLIKFKQAELANISLYSYILIAYNLK